MSVRHSLSTSEIGGGFVFALQPSLSYHLTSKPRLFHVLQQLRPHIVECRIVSSDQSGLSTCCWVGLLFSSFLSFSPPDISAQTNDFQFDRLTTQDGLSHNEVLSICQDSRGFMWFGTRDGLNRYDGHTLNIYRNIPGDSTSLYSNTVWDIREDKNGNLWVAGGALHKYDRDNDNFIRYLPDPDNPMGPRGWVMRVFPDIDGSSGLDKFDPTTGVFTRIDLGGVKDIFSIAEDDSGNLWLGVFAGEVIKLNKNTLRLNPIWISKASARFIMCIQIGLRFGFQREAGSLSSILEPDSMSCTTGILAKKRARPLEV